MKCDHCSSEEKKKERDEQRKRRRKQRRKERQARKKKKKSKSEEGGSKAKKKRSKKKRKKVERYCTIMLACSLFTPPYIYGYTPCFSFCTPLHAFFLFFHPSTVHPLSSLPSLNTLPPHPSLLPISFPLSPPCVSSNPLPYFPYHLLSPNPFSSLYTFPPSSLSLTMFCSFLPSSLPSSSPPLPSSFPTLLSLPPLSSSLLSHVYTVVLPLSQRVRVKMKMKMMPLPVMP